jgi:hypothetical protein
MAQEHYDDATTRDLAEQVSKFLLQLSEDEDNDETYYRAKEAIDTLGQMPDLDHLPPNRRIGPRGEGGSVESALKRRDEMAALLDVLVEQHEEHAATLPVDHGEVRSIRDVGTPDARGNRFVEVTHSDGHVERVMRDREEFERVEAAMRLQTDEAQRLQDLGHEIGQLNEIISNTADDALAEPFRKRRDELRTEVREERRVLVDAIASDLRERGLSEKEIAHSINEQWSGSAAKGGFGLRYTEQQPGVPEALEFLRAVKVDEFADHFSTMTPVARQQFMEKIDADPELRSVWENSVLTIEDPDEWKYVKAGR